MNKPVVVASFSFPHEAQIARASLESAGVQAIVADEHTISIQWLYSNALGGVKVLVAEEHLNLARSILNTNFAATVEEEFSQNQIACQECGSSDIKPYTKGKKPAFIVFILLGFPIFFYKHGIKCNVCGNFWEV